MKLEIQDEEEPRVEPEGNGEPSGSDARFSEDEGAVRCTENIARWRSYLPEGCIGTMINMGWDRST